MWKDRNESRNMWVHYSSAFFRDMGSLDGMATFKHVDCMFKVTRCRRQGSVEALTPWLKLAKHMFWNVKKVCRQNRLGLHLDEHRSDRQQICSSL